MLAVWRVPARYGTGVVLAASLCHSTIAMRYAAARVAADKARLRLTARLGVWAVPVLLRASPRRHLPLCDGRGLQQRVGRRSRCCSPGATIGGQPRIWVHQGGATAPVKLHARLLAHASGGWLHPELQPESQRPASLPGWLHLTTAPPHHAHATAAFGATHADRAMLKHSHERKGLGCPVMLCT